MRMSNIRFRPFQNSLIRSSFNSRLVIEHTRWNERVFIVALTMLEYNRLLISYRLIETQQMITNTDQFNTHSLNPNQVKVKWFTVIPVYNEK